MTVVIQPRAFCPTEHAFTIAGEFDALTHGYVEYANTGDFSNSFGNSQYGFSVAANTPFTHLVPVDPTCASSGDIVYYRLRLYNSGSFDEGATYRVRLRRPRSSTQWSFIVGPNGRDDISGDGLSAICNNFYLPTVNSLNADFICCPGDSVTDPSGSSLADSRSEYRLVRQSFEQINIPVFISPGDHGFDDLSFNKQARHEYFPCANLRTVGHQVIRAGQNDWQELESGTIAPPSSLKSVGSYYHFSWGNALFIVLNDWLDGNDAIGSGLPDLTHSSYIYQREWLVATLKEHRHKYKWCFTFTHSAVDETDPVNSNTIADVAAAKAYLMQIHSDYKINAHFHGHYHGWRVQNNDNGTAYVCSTFGATIDSSSTTWHGEYGLTHVQVGTDENGNTNDDKIKIDILGVGSGNSQNEILNVSDGETGIVEFVDSTVLNHLDDEVDISDVKYSKCAIRLGEQWMYNDKNLPGVDNTNLVTGGIKFYSADFVPQMNNDNISESTETNELWKTGTAPFYSNLSSTTDTWGAYYQAATSIGSANTSIGYGNPPWSTPTALNNSGVYVSSPVYFLHTFDLPDDIEPSELQLIYNIKDVAMIWINGELAHHTSGIGIPISDYIAPFQKTQRPSIDTNWFDANSSTLLSGLEPFATDNDNPPGGSGGTNYNGSRSKLPRIQYESGEQPVKIINPSVINKLTKHNNKIAVLLLAGRELSGNPSRSTTQSFFDLSLTVVGDATTTLIAPQILSPGEGQRFNRNTVNIMWNIHDPPGTDNALNTNLITYEIEYTDKYQGRNTNWHTIKRRIPYATTSYEWQVGKSIKSSTIRTRMRTYSSETESGSNWSISNEFSINVFDLIAPAIVNPLPRVSYSDFILIILDESLVRDTYNQKVRYTIEYSSEKKSIDWQTIVKDIPVGQNVIRWNLDSVPTSNDYILRLTAKNVSTSCIDTPIIQPDQIARQFVYDITIQHPGLFIIDTKPPQAILEIEHNIGVTNQREQIVNIYAEDLTTGIRDIRLRECDAGSILTLGDIDDPYDPLGGCASITEIVEDLSKFGKPIPFSPKTQLILEDKSGLKKIEALLSDYGGNISLQEQIRVFLSIFSNGENINDFILVIEQRDKITVDSSRQPPTVVAEPAVFEVVYLITSNRQLWVLEPFARLIWTLPIGIEPKILIDFTNAIYVLAYNAISDIGLVYLHTNDGPKLLSLITKPTYAGRNLPTSVAIYKNKIYIGTESGDLWSYNGLIFTHLPPPNTNPISTLFADNEYLYIGFSNSDATVLYDGSVFVELS